ncbi:hypothetical protein SDRG_09312 [Saprolegnia diclina VS20]|uniref:Uncharacterized protein n=1 Tax=Saprolegnia diclina (strain VS20) TaxID=1156394 RepID=T0QF20_SAPDV|nr:hypothetical protein SDRG_09312 [Saprolegnia diclina VS20]EQC33336.1 hypothetical protein SDRG_09312 [Saprolegnia diclina VS20]|eukprot:XP_008613459.1 hypothetical protein SDRG_09312 [Saprolegnia diclina VS20]
MTKKKVVANDVRETIYADVLHGMKFSKSPYGLFKQIAEKYGLASKTIRRIWLRGQESDGVVAHRVRGNKGRSRTDAQLQDINAKLNEIPHIEDKDLRSIAKAVDIPLSTLHKYMVQGVVKPKGHTHSRPKRPPAVPSEQTTSIEAMAPEPTAMPFEPVDLDERLPSLMAPPDFHTSDVEVLQEENDRLRRENYELVHAQRALIALQAENETLKARNMQLTHALRDLSTRVQLETI